MDVLFLSFLNFRHIFDILSRPKFPFKLSYGSVGQENAAVGKGSTQQHVSLFVLKICASMNMQ